LAQFPACVVANVADARNLPPAAPRRFRCRKTTVEADLARDGAIAWACPSYGAEGRISNWRASLWELRERPVPQR